MGTSPVPAAGKAEGMSLFIAPSPGFMGTKISHPILRLRYSLRAHLITKMDIARLREFQKRHTTTSGEQAPQVGHTSFFIASQLMSIFTDGPAVRQ